MLKRFRLRILAVALFLLVLFGALWYRSIRDGYTLPRFLNGRFAARLTEEINGVFQLDSVEIAPAKGTVKIFGAKILAPGVELPVFSADGIVLTLGPGRTFSGLLRGLYPALRLDILDGRLVMVKDLTDIIPEKHRRVSKRPPIEHLIIDSLEIVTPVGPVLVKEVKADLPFGSLPAKVSFRVVNNPLSGEGAASGTVPITTDAPASLQLAWTDLDLKAVHGAFFLDWLFGIPETAGKLDCCLSWEGNLRERIGHPQSDWRQLLGKELSGWIKFRDGSTTLLQETLRFDGSVERSGDQPPILQVTVGWASGSARVSGNAFSPDRPPGDLDLRIESTRARLPREVEARLASEGIAFGFTDIAGDLWREQGIPGMEASGTFLDGRWQGLNIPEGRWEAARSPSHWWGSGTFLFSSGMVFGEGMLDGAFNAPERFSIVGGVEDFSLANLASFVPLPLGGRAFGAFIASGPVWAPASTSYRLSADLFDVSLSKFHFEHLAGMLSGQGQDWVLWNPYMHWSGGGQIALDGSICAGNLAGRIFGEEVPLSTFRVPSRIVDGRINFSGAISGTPKNARVHGDAWTENLSVFGHQFSPIRSGVEIQNKRLTLANLGGYPDGGGQMEGRVEIDLDNGDLLETHLDFTNLDVGVLRKVIPEAYFHVLPQGTVSGSFRKKLSGIADAWDFSLRGEEWMVASESVRTVSLTGTILENQVEITDGTVEAFGGRLGFKGKYLPEQGFQCAIEGSGFLLGQISALHDAFPGSSGEVSVDGEIAWNAEEKKGLFTIFGKDCVFRTEEIGNFGAEIRVDEKEIFIHQASFDGLGVQAHGRLGLGRPQEYEFSLEFKDADFSFLPSAYGYRFEKGECQVSGKAELGGVLGEAGPRMMQVHLTPVVIRRGQDSIVANRPIEVLYQNGRFEFRSLELKYRNGILGIEGVLDPFAGLALTINGTDFSLAALGNLIERTQWEYDGTISLNGGVSGTFAQPLLKTSVQLKNFSWGGRRIPEVQAAVKATREGLELAPLEILFPRNSIRLAGFIPFSQASESRDLNLEVRIASGPIDDFVKLFPDFLGQAVGNIRADLRCTGKIHQPVIVGNLLLEAQEFGFKGMRRPLKNLKIGLNTTDRVVQITPLQAEVGRGMVTGSGIIDFRDGLASTAIDLTGTNLDMSWGGLEFSRTDTYVQVRGDLYNPVVRGNIRIPRGKFQVGELSLSKFDKKLDLPLQSLDYLFEVTIPRNFWLKHSFLNAEMKGNFRIAGDLEDVRLDGGFQTVQGWLYFQRRKFLIDTGEVKFGERDGQIDPHFFFKSKTNIQNTQVFLTLSGRVSSFTSSLHSAPPMDEGDLLTLLTFNRRMDQTMNADPKDLLEKEVLEGLKNTYLSGFIGSTISSALNLDELFLDSLFDRTTGITRSFLRIGKYLGRNFFVAYEGTMSNDERKTYIIEYRLPRGFLVNFEVEKPTDRMQIGVKYDWKFW